MNIFRSASRVAAMMIGAALALSMPATALAQAYGTPAPSTEGKNASDLRHLCPGIDTALEEALGAVWHQVGLTSTVNVQMRVDGREVTLTRVSGGPIEYRRAVDRAAARLTCDAGAGSIRVLGFDVHFVRPDGAAGAPAQLARR